MNSDAAGSCNFDRLLETELRCTLGNLEGPSPDARQSSYQARFLAGLRSGSRRSIPLLFSGRLMLVVAGMAVLVASGSVAAMAGWAGPRPEVWGRAITTAVEECRDQLAGGQHGIGECVSAAAKERGEGQPSPNPRAGSGIQASGAAVGASAGPGVHPSPGDDPGPAVIPGTGPEQVATSAAPASNGRGHAEAANQGAGQSRSPGRGGRPDNRGSGKPKDGGGGKPNNGGGGKSKGHAPASPSPRS